LSNRVQPTRPNGARGIWWTWRTSRLYVPVDVFGDRAEKVAEAVGAGDTVLVDGKLRWRSWFDKRGEKQGKLAVLAWSVEKA
jgi:single-stranded DNA-binding protein